MTTPAELSALYSQAIGLLQDGQWDKVAGLCDQILASAPDHPETLHMRGVADLQRQRYAEALARFDRALALKPDYAPAHINRGAACLGLGQYAEALSSSDRALAINPAALNALNNRGVALNHLDRPADAVAAANQALVIDPADEQALATKMEALQVLGRHDDTIAVCDQILKQTPRNAVALVIRGAARIALNQPEAAHADFAAALAIDAGLDYVPGTAIYLALRTVQWDSLEAWTAKLRRRLANHEPVSRPYHLLAVTLTAEELHRGTTEYFDRVLKRTESPLPARPRNGKIRIGYFSEDFFAHAVSHLIKGLLPLHDRDRFEVLGFAFSGGQNDDIRMEVARGLDRLIDLPAASPDEIARLARGHGIDIALDLNGFTGAARQPEVFAFRTAPVQINYLGYPGTCGGECYDYIIGDPIVTPPEHRSWFREKFIVMPHAYQPNDFRAYAVAPPRSRTSLGLPEKGFVFCCFNDGFKFTPEVFDIWMRLLAAVDGSVLWVLEVRPSAMANLRREAEVRGIAPDRLVFAPRMGISDHLGRHRAADLFLDTSPYNAHTTASDALWAGLPLVAWQGQTFAARVAASLVTAAGLPELVTGSLEAYEELALALALQPKRLAALRERLEKGRLTCPLFDTARYARNIDRAFEAVWHRHEAGLPPDHIAVIEP